MKKKHVFRPDAGEGLELRLAPSVFGTLTVTPAEIASVSPHGEHKSHSHEGGHKNHNHGHHSKK